jgi:DNA-3-methyladenine glycosylase II
MLGLSQQVEAFEQRYREHPQLGRLIVRQPGLRVPVTATPFEALTWAVMGQAISVQAAVSLRRKLILLAGLRHSSGLFCYPEAQHVALLDEDNLRQAGFSTAKARTLRTLSRLVGENRLPLEEWLQTVPVEEMQRRFQEVRGIGPWTISYVLLRGYGWLDGSLHGDIAVRKGLQALLALPDTISMEQARQWLAEFTPWRALVAAHLWHQQM